MVLLCSKTLKCVVQSERSMPQQLNKTHSFFYRHEGAFTIV